MVERVLGKNEVLGSIPNNGSVAVQCCIVGWVFYNFMFCRDGRVVKYTGL
jgi:hypothetical protein